MSQVSNEESVTVSVADTGCGMDEKTRNRIFDKFYQGDISNATEGNGLGLALVKRILQPSDGSIEAISKIGQGKRTVLVIVNMFCSWQRKFEFDEQ